MQGFMEQARQEAMKTISIGFGAYLSLLVSVYFAGIAARRFLASKPGHSQGQPEARKLAA